VANTPIALSISNNFIAVADLMKSVSVIEYKHGEANEPDSLVEVARHFQVVWATAMAAIEDDTFLESDSAGNIIVLHRDINGVTEDDKRRLRTISEIRLGEMVNKIQRSESRRIGFLFNKKMSFC
jgi:DNA damage-binding protein 1